MESAARLWYPLRLKGNLMSVNRDDANPIRPNGSRP